jgi:hypothetical protein
LVGNFKLNRSAGFLLDHGRSITHATASAYVNDLQPDEITASELAVDGKIEQRQVTRATLQLEPDTYGSSARASTRAAMLEPRLTMGLSHRRPRARSPHQNDALAPRRAADGPFQRKRSDARAIRDATADRPFA